MITKPKSAPITLAPEFWGKVKGMVRHIQVAGDGSEATYVFEESPGWREIRYNRRRYRIFFPWMYFFIRVFASCKTPVSGMLYAFISKKQAKDIEEICLRLAPFPSSHKNGWICMPSNENASETPIECALKVIHQFWYANSSDLEVYGSDVVPDKLAHKVREDRRGAIFTNWSKLTPAESMNLEYQELGMSIQSFCRVVNWKS